MREKQRSGKHPLQRESFVFAPIAENKTAKRQIKYQLV